MEIDQLIYKKLEGSITTEENSILSNWLADKNSPQNQIIFQEIERHWQSENEKLDLYKANALKKFQEKIAEPATPIHQTRKTNFIGIYAKIAAAVILLIGVFAIWFSYQQEPAQQLVEVKPVEMITKYNPAGIKTTLVLPDKSKVKLNADSKLIFPKSFNGKTREVTLDGEAFFEIEENPEKPFIVHTREISTEVKGTSFNVSAYPSNNNVSIAVVTGLVLSYNKENQVYIKPGEMAVYNEPDNSDIQILKRKYTPDEIAWKDGKIIFKKSSFEEVKKELELWYGIKITTQRPINFDKGFTGSYQNESLKGIMESISFAGKFKYKIDIENKELLIW